MLSALTVIEKLTYPAWWRAIWPSNELRKHGYNVDCCHFSELRDRDAHLYDLVIMPRVAFPADHWLEAWTRDLQRSGRAWVYDADDDLWSPDWVQRQVYAVGRDAPRADRRRLHEQFERERQQRERILRRCDGVTVATAELAGRLERPSEVVPDYIDVAWFERKRHGSRRVVDGLTVGWAGGGRLPSDFEPLPEVWAEIARRHPQVTFVAYGVETEPLINAVPANRLVTFDWTPVQAYPAVLQNIDIMCCVLPGTHSNRAKSPIKWMEATVTGAVCVVSPTVYGSVVCHEETALVAESHEEWVEALDRLIRDAELRRDLTTRARDEVEARWSLDNHWLRWPEAWERSITA